MFKWLKVKKNNQRYKYNNETFWESAGESILQGRYVTEDVAKVQEPVVKFQENVLK